MRRPGNVAIALAATATAAAAAVALVGAGAAPAVPAAAQYAPQNTSKPTISDTTPAVGETLTASTGAWQSSSSVSYTYQWRRCNGGGNNCTDIAGATNTAYKVGSADAGNTLRVQVTARNSDGSSTASSDATGKVGETTPPPAGGALPISSVTPPNRLVVDSVRFNPNPITSANATITIRVRVTDAQSHRSVSGALVFVRSTPQVTTSTPETKTGSDGWATLTTRPERDFGIVFRPNYNLQFFVRTREPGGDLLAGISGRRLVQVALAPRG